MWAGGVAQVSAAPTRPHIPSALCSPSVAGVARHPRAEEPKRHEYCSSAPPAKLEPYTVSAVPPEAGPLAGETLEAAHSALYAYGVAPRHCWPLMARQSGALAVRMSARYE